MVVNRGEVQFPQQILEERTDEGTVCLDISRHLCARENPLLPTSDSRHPTPRGIICALLNPDPSRRLTAERALAYLWPTTFVPPTEYDVCVVREIFDLLACRASEKRLKHVSCVIVVPSTTIPLESSSRPSRTVLMSTEVLNQKGVVRDIHLHSIL